MQNTILMTKILDECNRNKYFVINISDIEMIQMYSTINILLKYKQVLNLMDNEVAIDLRLWNVKKY